MNGEAPTEVWSRLKNDSAEASAQERLGESLLRAGRPADHIGPLRRSADLFRRNGDQAAEARARNMLAFPLALFTEWVLAQVP